MPVPGGTLTFFDLMLAEQAGGLSKASCSADWGFMAGGRGLVSSLISGAVSLPLLSA